MTIKIYFLHIVFVAINNFRKNTNSSLIYLRSFISNIFTTYDMLNPDKLFEKLILVSFKMLCLILETGQLSSEVS